MAVKTFSVGELATSSDVNTFLTNSGLVFVKSGSFTAETEILLDSVFTSTFRNYRLLFDCQSSAGGSIFTLQMRAAGSTVVTTTYKSSTIDVDGTSITSSRSTAQTSYRFGANDTGAYHSSTVDIFTPQLALPTRFIASFNRNSAQVIENTMSANTTLSAMDGLRIAVGSGNMTGAYALYGARTA